MKGIFAAEMTFDAFRGSSPTVLRKAGDIMSNGLKSIYKIENRIALFCMVIALILAGISFIAHSGSKKDVSQNKTVITRVIVASACIFAATGIITFVAGLALE